MGENKNHIAIIITAIVILSGGVFYLLNYRSENTSLAPGGKKEKVVKEMNSAGTVSQTDGVGFEIALATHNSDNKKYFSVSANTLFYTVNFSANNTQESPIVFSKLKVGQEVVVTFKEESENNIALKVMVPNLPPPPPNILSARPSTPVPPPGQGE